MYKDKERKQRRKVRKKFLSKTIYKIVDSKYAILESIVTNKRVKHVIVLFVDSGKNKTVSLINSKRFSTFLVLNFTFG